MTTDAMHRWSRPGRGGHPVPSLRYCSEAWILVHSIRTSMNFRWSIIKNQKGKGVGQTPLFVLLPILTLPPADTLGTCICPRRVPPERFPSTADVADPRAHGGCVVGEGASTCRTESWEGLSLGGGQPSPPLLEKINPTKSGPANFCSPTPHKTKLRRNEFCS